MAGTERPGGETPGSETAERDSTGETAESERARDSEAEMAGTRQQKAGQQSGGATWRREIHARVHPTPLDLNESSASRYLQACETRYLGWGHQILVWGYMQVMVAMGGRDVVTATPMGRVGRGARSWPARTPVGGVVRPSSAADSVVPRRDRQGAADALRCARRRIIGTGIRQVEPTSQDRACTTRVRQRTPDIAMRETARPRTREIARPGVREMARH